MPSTSFVYTLVGFSAELDWRPLHFIEPIPRNRVCSVCGLVLRKTALLPCMHALCDSCYQWCAQDGSRLCPHDGRECQDEDVDWKLWAANEMLRREVACWNKERGCETVIAASEISRHFQLECGRHSVSCLRCSVQVLRSDMCSHLRSDCDAEGNSPQSEYQVPATGNGDKSFFTSFGGAFEKQAADIRTSLEHIAAGTAMHDDRLNNLSQGLNILKETMIEQLAAERRKMHDILTKGMRDLNVLNEEVKQSLIAQSAAINNLSETIGDLEKKLKDEISNATSGTKEHVTQNAINIKAEVKESVQRPLEKITEVMRCGRLQATECNFSVPHVKSLKKKALKEGSARYEHKVVYLRGYCVLPAVWLVGEGGSVKVHAGMTLYKGDMDDIVQWPLKNKVRLSVNHQRNGSKLQFDVTARYFGEDFHRPRESHNDYFYFGTESLYLGGLFAAGYVENDKLFVNWELLPLSAHQSETE